MVVAVTYPGVYIQEIPSGVTTIVGVATSIGAFVDNFLSGPTDKAVRVLSWADFENVFGGLYAKSEGSYAVQQFFLNGGADAYVVRVGSATAANAPTIAAVGLADVPGNPPVLTISASSAGGWGGGVRIEVDFGGCASGAFNMTVTEIVTTGGQAQVTATETYRGVTINPASPTDVAAIVNANSQLISVTEATGSTGKAPAQTGTAGTAPTLSTLAVGDAMTVSLSGGASLGTVTLAAPLPTTYSQLASTLQGALRSLTATANAVVNVVGAGSSSVYLVADAGTTNPADYLAFADASASSTLATKLGWGAKTNQNVQQYTLGGSAAQAQTLPGGSTKAQGGSDGTWDPVNDATGVTTALIGDPAAKTGMNALLDVDLFNLLSIPTTMDLPDVNAAAVATSATALCTLRRAFYLFDVPQQAADRDTPSAMLDWLGANATLRSRNSAVYFPRVAVPDPQNGFRLRASASSGTLMGLFARIDGTRGVWKAPAGTEATLTNVQSLEYKLTDAENGVLNPLAANCLRTFPVFGSVCWGARTLKGADQLADDYKYVPVRRLALYIEESLYRGTQWAVFEPNDEPLWSQLRLDIGTFMQTLFRQGAFQGQTPQDAYFVKCDGQTTTQNDINLGIVNVVVGFAPLKPAEFVIIQIQQLAGQAAS
jgi:phage tail sheath protein FI